MIGFILLILTIIFILFIFNLPKDKFLAPEVNSYWVNKNTNNLIKVKYTKDVWVDGTYLIQYEDCSKQEIESIYYEFRDFKKIYKRITGKKLEEAITESEIRYIIE
jgi:hypothetical protein